MPGSWRMTARNAGCFHLDVIGWTDERWVISSSRALEGFRFILLQYFWHHPVFGYMKTDLYGADRRVRLVGEWSCAAACHQYTIDDEHGFPHVALGQRLQSLLRPPSFQNFLTTTSPPSGSKIKISECFSQRLFIFETPISVLSEFFNWVFAMKYQSLSTENFEFNK